MAFNYEICYLKFFEICYMKFSFPNLINFLKLAECALSIDSECYKIYCLMSDFFLLHTVASWLLQRP